MIIVLLVLLSICLLQVSHPVPYPVWRAPADYLFLRARGGFPAGMIMGLSAVEVTLHECLELAVVSGDVIAHRAIVEGAEFLEDTVDHLR